MPVRWHALDYFLSSFFYFVCLAVSSSICTCICLHAWFLLGVDYALNAGDE